MEKRTLIDGIFILDGVLSAEECRAWIAFSETHDFDSAEVSGAFFGAAGAEARRSTRVVFDDFARAAAIYRRVAPLLPAARPGGFRLHGLSERLRFYRYDAGQRIAWHSDTAVVRSPTIRSFQTMLLSLNDDFTGGASLFFTPDRPGGTLRVEPRAGRALVFDHHEPRLHAAEPVEGGRRYVLRTDVMFELQPGRR